MTQIDDRATPRWATRTIAASTVLAWLAIGLFIASMAILAVPVSNPPIQDCGVPGVFLLKGTPDASLYDSAGEPKGGLDREGLQKAYDNRCSRKVGRRAWPAAVTGAGFVLVSLLGLLLAFLGHRAERRSENQA